MTRLGRAGKRLSVEELKALVALGAKDEVDFCANYGFDNKARRMRPSQGWPGKVCVQMAVHSNVQFFLVEYDDQREEEP